MGPQYILAQPVSVGTRRALGSSSIIMAGWVPVPSPPCPGAHLPMLCTLVLLLTVLYVSVVSALTLSARLHITKLLLVPDPLQDFWKVREMEREELKCLQYTTWWSPTFPDQSRHPPLSARYDVWGLVWSCEQVYVQRSSNPIFLHPCLTQEGKGWLQRIDPLWSSTQPNPYLGRPAWVHEKNTWKKGCGRKGGRTRTSLIRGQLHIGRPAPAYHKGHRLNSVTPLRDRCQKKQDGAKTNKLARKPRSYASSKLCPPSGRRG